VSIWLAASVALILALIPCGVISARGAPLDRLLGLQLAGPIGGMALVTLAEGFDRSVYVDVALVFVVVNVVSTLVYIRLLERSK
jgi:multisubunit Na+/H+ antiporter MnhF subunit